MFRIPFLVAIALVTAFGGGIWLTKYAIGNFLGFDAVRLGTWQAFPKAQTVEADPFAKSNRANASTLLLGGAEGLAFYASSDSSGAALNSACTYVISGSIPQARFWTLTAREPGSSAPPEVRKGLPVALSARTVLYREDGSLEIFVSPNAMPGSWLAVPDSGHYQLVITLFDTPVAGSSGLIEPKMPEIKKEGCNNA